MTAAAIRAYLRRIGAAGGKAGTGKAKARASDVARAAALARWGVRKTDCPNSRKND